MLLCNENYLNMNTYKDVRKSIQVRKHLWKHFIRFYNFKLFIYVVSFCFLFSFGIYSKALKIVIKRKHDFDHITPLLRILP